MLKLSRNSSLTDEIYVSLDERDIRGLKVYLDAQGIPTVIYSRADRKTADEVHRPFWVMFVAEENVVKANTLLDIYYS